jgi:hypothetical protein
MSHFGVDRQYLGTECYSSILSQQTVRWVDASFGLKCRVVGLSVDGSSRHRSTASFRGKMYVGPNTATENSYIIVIEGFK